MRFDKTLPTLDKVRTVIIPELHYMKKDIPLIWMMFRNAREDDEGEESASE